MADDLQTHGRLPETPQKSQPETFQKTGTQSSTTMPPMMKISSMKFTNALYNTHLD
jgi:hypothetical protein